MFLTIVAVLLFSGCSTKKYYSLRYNGELQYPIEDKNVSLQKIRKEEKKKMVLVLKKEFNETDEVLRKYSVDSFYDDASKRYQLLFGSN